MKIFFKKVNGLVIPSQATKDDAAYDIVASTDGFIVGESIERSLDGLKMWKRVAYIEYGTNLFIAPENEPSKIPGSLVSHKFHTLLHPRSSISKYNLVLANSVGLVDNGYCGEIRLRYKYIFQPEDMLVVPEVGGTRFYGIVRPEYIYNRGDKICQIKASPNISIEWEQLENLSDTQRGVGGFGSTGK